MKFVKSVIFSASLLIWSTSSYATIVIEDGSDAGDLPATAQILPGGTTSVEGDLDEAYDVDMFGFSWGGGSLTLTLTGGPDMDSQLFLFDSAGLGLWHNDDFPSFPSSISEITATLAVGAYFAAVSNSDMDPKSVAGFIFPSGSYGDQLGPTGPGGSESVMEWGVNEALYGEDDKYTLNFSAPTVPEPSAIALMGLGLLGFGATRRKQKKV